MAPNQSDKKRNDILDKGTDEQIDALPEVTDEELFPGGHGPTFGD